MADLSTAYLGLKLRSPIVVSACTLSQELDNLRRMEAAGAGAIVLYSLFEEQIELEELGYGSYYKNHPEALPPALQSVAQMEEFRQGASGYLAYLYQAKRAVNIPVIASLNGYYSRGWTQYARLLEAAGADAIELNIYYLATKRQVSASDVEQMYVNLVRNVKQTVKVPVAVKLSPYFSAMTNVAHLLDKAGADALVLFNRFYQPDFDIETGLVTPSLDLSTPEELRLRLRWVAMLHGQLQADLAITGGVHAHTDVIKSLMAGARVCLVASSLYRHGIEHIGTLLEGTNGWLDAHGRNSVSDIYGTMSVTAVGDPAAFERANYMRVLKSYKGEPPEE